jgi:hypothetical protein
MLYLPIWIGMTIKGITAHKKRIWKVSIENILMVGGLLVLFLSFSRIGWLAMIAVSAYLFFRLMVSLSKKWVGQISNRRKSPLTLLNTIFLYILIWLAFFLFIIALILAAGLILTRLDPRMAGLFNIGLIADKGILEWASTMIFAERLVYWIAGINVFFKYPIMGVGLGNAGYFFPQTFNAFSYKLTEIMEILVRDSFIPNAKNLWVRLLAETGIVGFSIFLSWLYIHWKSARFLEQSQQKWFISFGFVGQIFLVAFFMEGFSLDTFGLPYYWISMALIVAVLRIKLNHPIELPNLEI